MGVDCRIWLPPYVRIRDVANVIGILAGLPAEKKYFNNNNKNSWYCRVPAVKVNGIESMPECAGITFGEPPNNFYVLFHYETSDRDNYKLLQPRSFAFWLAIGTRLIRFFGGRITYNDYYDRIDEEVVIGSVGLNPYLEENDESWHHLQESMYNLRPITLQEFKSFERRAAYDTPDWSLYV